MAQIPMGNGGRAVAGGVPLLQQRNETGASEQATAGLLDTAQRVNLQMTADNTRLADEERRRQEAVAEAAARARDTVQLENTEGQIKLMAADINDQVLAGQIPKDQARAVLAERAKKITDEALPGFREQTRALVQPRLTGLAVNQDFVLRRTIETKNRQDVTADMGQRLETLSRKYATDPAAAETEAMATFDTLGPFSTMNAAQLASARQKWKEEAQYTAAFTLVRGASQDAGQLQSVLKALDTTDYMPAIDPQRRAELVDKARAAQMRIEVKQEQARQAADRQAAAYMRNAEAAAGAFRMLADKGTALDPATTDATLNATKGTPWHGAVRAMAEEARVTGGLAAQSLGQQDALLRAIDAKIVTDGRSTELDKMRDRVEKVKKGAEADIKEVGGLRAYAMRRNGFVPAPLNLGAGIEGLVKGLDERVKQADEAGQWSGKPESPFMPEEARLIAGLLASRKDNEFGQAVAILGARVPARQMAAIAEQIDKQDRNMALAFKASQSDPAVAEWIRRGATAVKDKTIKVDDSPGAGVSFQLAQALDGRRGAPQVLGGQIRADVLDAAQHVFVGKEAAGQRISPAKAIEMVLGGPVVKRSSTGQRIPVPAGVDGDSIEDKLNAAGPALQAQSDGGKLYIAGVGETTVDQFMPLMDKTELVVTGPGRYQIRYRGGLVVGKDGKRVEVSVK